MLRIKKTSEGDHFHDALAKFKHSIYVDMHHKGSTCKEPLFSDNFANCLALIVHDHEKKRGYLLHIFPGSSGGTDIYNLFNYVDEQIEKILTDFSKSNLIDMFLWKGISYSPQILKNLTMSYAEYAAKKFGKRINIIDSMDGTNITFESKILYNPEMGEIFIIDVKHGEFFDKSTLKKASHKKLESRQASFIISFKKKMEISSILEQKI